MIAAASFRSGEKTSARVWTKPGGSPVTEADVAVDLFLQQRLAAFLPEAGWLSEETRDDPRRMERDLVWVVDPIDGTRAFLSGDRNWSVSIALLAGGEPVEGIVYAPALDALYEAARGGGATLNGVRLETTVLDKIQGARVAGPKPLVDALERAAGPLLRLPKVPSLALRLARVAAGDIDAGLISLDARDWDIAAADLILNEAGGRLTTLDGARPIYNRPAPVHGVLVAAGARLHAAALSALAHALGGMAGRDGGL